MGTPAHDPDRELTPDELTALLERAKREEWTTLALLGPRCVHKQVMAAHLRSVVEDDPAWSPDHIALVPPLKISDLTRLGDLPSLRVLELSGCGISPEGAAKLATLTQLTSLDLAGNRIGDKGAARLATLIRLTNLNLADNDIGPEGAATLEALSRLAKLNLWNNSIGDVGAAELAALPRLTSINLRNNSIGPNGAAKLATFPRLTSINLRNNSVGPKGAATLATLTRLTSLDLGGNSIGPEGAAKLEALTRLTNLDLWNNSIGDKGAAKLATLTRLTSLNLENNALTLTPELLAAFQAMPRLTSLDLHKNLGLGIDDSELPPHQPAVVIERLAAKLAGTARPWREVKIALLGDGEVGKSMLRWRLAPLKGESPPKDGREGRTRAWERRRLTFAVPVERESPVTRTDTAATPRAFEVAEITAHLFDFGGQTFLWGSHRLFLGVNRSLYTIVARADKPLDGPDNRITHWVRMVQEMRQQWIRMKAEAKHRRAIDEGKEQAGEWARSGRAEVIESIAGRLEKETPYPPLVIVITRAAERPETFENDVARLKDKLREFARTPGEIPMRIVELGDAGGTARKDADGVKALWNDVLAGPAIPELQNSTDTVSFRALRQALNTKFPPVDSSEPSPGDSALIAWVTEQECRDEIARADPNVDPGLAVQYLSELRDVGIVHWVGDAPDHLVAPGDAVRELIFNPGWTARPLCEVLWGDARLDSKLPVFQKRLGVYSQSEMLVALRTFMRNTSERNANQKLLDLAVASRIVHKVDPPGATKGDGSEVRYLVPDHFDIKKDVQPNAGFNLRWNPPFLADAAMPRLIGALWDLRDGETVYRNRMGLKVTLGAKTESGKTAQATLAQVPVGDARAIELVALSGDAKAGEELVRRVKAAAAAELGVEPMVGEAMSEAPDDQLVNKWTWLGGPWLVQYVWQETGADGKVTSRVEKAHLQDGLGVRLIGRLLAQTTHNGCRVSVLDLYSPEASKEDKAKTKTNAKNEPMPPIAVIRKYRELKRDLVKQPTESEKSDPAAQATREEVGKKAVDLESRYPWLEKFESNMTRLVESVRKAISRVYGGEKPKVGEHHGTRELAIHLRECIGVEMHDVVYGGNVVKWEPPQLPSS